MVKKLFTILVFFVTFTTLSQETKILLSGKVIDSLGIVKNANIINIQTNQGTFSSDDGRFRIFVSEGDSLQVSTVQHITKKIRITKTIKDLKSLTVTLTSTTYVLDAFDLKRNDLMGRLTADLKEVPRNRKDSLLSKVLDFSNINFKQKDPTIDAVVKAKPPTVNTVPNSFGGAGAGAKIPFRDSERLWALRKKLERKKQFPYKIMSKLGEKFFFEKLKIPVDQYFHFLEYCNPLGIEELHKEKRILELIKIFQKESVPYLKIIKKE
ncbi:hypothetical protein [Polaribacter sp. L3A8]|uniref:hypothetical protein n=1 Tax=Polaribacter sp. L3A8 TaxID=2686361 RepID=UPI00131E61FB|nr:hypothetical protein [Polaribacter sp. L3A8]